MLRPIQGKGNKGMFVDRVRGVCAAGLPSAQPEETVAGCLSTYSLQDEVNALVGDLLIPEPKPHELPPMDDFYTEPIIKQPITDIRHAGLFSEAHQLINPPVNTRFKTMVEEFKNTMYSSYWKSPVGAGRDETPYLPEGFDKTKTTLGKKTERHGSLYDLVMLKHPIPDQTPNKTKAAGFQTNRKYSSSYNSDLTYGMRIKANPNGICAKRCLTVDESGKVNCSGLVDFTVRNRAKLGRCLEPNNNINNVPLGFTFGKLEPPAKDSSDDNNPERDHLRKCLTHLNTLRKCMRKRFNETFYDGLYLKMKYFDKNTTGWLPKEFVYDFCSRRFVRFTPSLLDPLLTLWNVLDGDQIEYKTFIKVINPGAEVPVLPNVWYVAGSDFTTTYSEMNKPQETDGRLRAGLPSGRYLDMDYPITPHGCCKAHQTYLPHESDVRSCMFPSILTQFGINHRDMYAKRTPDVVRKVFEAAGDKFTDEEFETLWNIAKKNHSQEWVSFETFRRAIDKEYSANIKF